MAQASLTPFLSSSPPPNTTIAKTHLRAPSNSLPTSFLPPMYRQPLPSLLQLLSLRWPPKLLPYPLHGLPHSLTPVSFFKFGSAPKLPDVVQAGDPVLHEMAAPVPLEDILSERVQKVIDDMVAVMRSAPGVGLAAPQIGVPLQIIVLEDTKEYISYAPKVETDAQQRYPFELRVIINPALKKKGHSTASFFEGCLSINGFRGLVERHLEVEVTGFERDGRPIRFDAFGWEARILQHECDHLEGLLYVDRLIPRTFRTVENLRLPLPKGCPVPGVCLRHGGSIDLDVE